MALIRGRSNGDDLDRLARLIHSATYALQMWIYFEWVESKSNWSDGVSRVGPADPWCASHGIVPTEVAFPEVILGLPIQATILVFEYL